MADFGRLLELLTHNDRVLSRTVKTGRVDTDASHLKKSLIISEACLLDTIHRNRSAVARFITTHAAYVPRTSAEIVGALLTIAFLSNDGVVAGGIFRQWTYNAQVKELQGKEIAPNDIPGQLWRVGGILLDASNYRQVDERLELIASVEWEIGIGPLHPFYDGCGRISRYYTAINSLWFGVPLKRQQERDQYMRHASKGKRHFIEYYKSLPDASLDG